MQIPWYVTALGAAVVWGVHYPLVDFALKRLSMFSVLLLSILPIVLVAPLFHQSLANDLAIVKKLPATDQWVIGMIGFTSSIGAVLLYLSIVGKNATLAALIEITYPVFVLVFSYLLFRQVHFNLNVLIGGAMVIIGAGMIIYHNQ